MSSISSFALFVSGTVTLLYSLFFLFAPNALLSWFYGSPVHVEQVAASLCQYFGVTNFCLAFLYLHYLPFADKHGQGLRLAVMHCGGNLMVALHRIYLSGSGSSWTSGIVAAKKTLIIQGVMLLLSNIALKKALREAKTKKKK